MWWHLGRAQAQGCQRDAGRTESSHHRVVATWPSEPLSPRGGLGRSCLRRAGLWGQTLGGRTLMLAISPVASGWRAAYRGARSTGAGARHGRRGPTRRSHGGAGLAGGGLSRGGWGGAASGAGS